MMPATTALDSARACSARRFVLPVATGLVILAVILAPRLTWPALLITALYLLGIMLGSTFFLALQHLAQARWSRSIEFVPRLLSGLLPWTFVLLVPVLTLGLPTLYEWSHTGDTHHGGHGPTSGFKATWLSPAFFWARTAVYLLVFGWFARAFARNAGKGVGSLYCPAVASCEPLPKKTPDPFSGGRPTGLAAGFIVLFAITCVASSFDWIMSIDSHWFSTIFGVYNFTGMFVSALAAITLILILQSKSRHVAVVRPEQLHDLGRLLFGFSCFWAYIWFSQYMLIWYSNIPEETGYYALRHSGIWQQVSFLNVVCNFVVPFVALLSSTAKRNPATMAAVCVVLLVGRALDLAFMILPPFAGNSAFGLIVAFGAVAGGLYLLGIRLNRDVRILRA